MSTYQEKIEAKKARYAELAEKATAASIEASTAAYKNLKILPFGQPILVDHSSANKHRRHIANQLAPAWCDRGTIRQGTHPKRHLCPVPCRYEEDGAPG